MTDFESFWADRNAEFQGYLQATEKDMTEKLNALRTYGNTGDLPDGLNIDLLDDLCCVVLATEAVAHVRGFETEPLMELKDALTVFFARLKLDIESQRELPPTLDDAQGLVHLISGVSSDYLTVHELSLLWNMHPNNIRGEILNQSDVKPLIEKKDKLVLIPAVLALSLSLKRRNFDASQAVETDDTILVPITAGGDFFNIHCRNNNGFRIGRKGEEYLVKDFDEALNALKTMRPKAYWRRKNASGNWGIVAAIRWEPRPINNVK